MDPTVIAAGAVAVSLASLAHSMISRRGDSGVVTAGRLVRIETILDNLQKDMSRLANVMEKFAEVQSDVRNLDTRLVSAEQDIRDVQRGRGYVTKSKFGSIDGEYGNEGSGSDTDASGNRR